MRFFRALEAARSHDSGVYVKLVRKHLNVVRTPERAATSSLSHAHTFTPCRPISPFAHCDHCSNNASSDVSKAALSLQRLRDQQPGGSVA